MTTDNPNPMASHPTDPTAAPPLQTGPLTPAADPADPAYHHSGNGKVARLPKKVRDQIGMMILDGVPYANIILALGEHGKDLTDANIGNWRANTFRDWFADYQRKQALTATHEAALDLLEHSPAVPVQDAGRTIAAAQLYELLLAFEPKAFADALCTKPELYLRLINALSRLSEGESACGHRRIQNSLIQSKLLSDQPVEPKKLLTREELMDLCHQMHLF